MHGVSARTARLFLALWPDEPCRNAIADLTRKIHWPAGAAVYAPWDWHVTLHFLGGVPVERMPDLEQAVDIRMSPVVVTLNQLCVWQRGLVVLAASVISEEMIELHDRLGQRLKIVGCKADERAYRPHLTLARKAPEFHVPDLVPQIRWTADRFALVESTGHPAARYRSLAYYS